MAMTSWVHFAETTVLFFAMGHVHFSHFVPFPLFVSQPERKNEGNQVSSKLKKDSLQDGKHTMGVSHHFPVAVVSKKKTQQQCTCLSAPSFFVGRLCAVLHNVLVFHP